MQRRHFLKTGATVMGALPFVNIPSLVLPDLFGSTEEEIFKIKLGRCQCTIFRDNIHSYTAEDYFLDVPPEELSAALKKYAANPENMPSPFVAMLLQYDDRKVLIDTGLGYAEKPVLIGDFSLEKKGRLLQLMASENIRKEDITDVVITHFHPDHIGGNFNEEKQPVFKNAKFHMHRDEWDFWHSSRADAQSAFFKFFVADQITPLKDGNLNLFSGELNEILPGVTAVLAPGHTPGHFAVHMNFEKEQLLYASDAFIHPLHIERLGWRTKYDMDHEEAKRSREKLLDLAYRENMLINAFHFDFPGLGRVAKEEGNWKWIYST